MSGVEQSIEIEVPREAFFAVIRDYERYPEFIPEIERASVVRRDGSTLDVRFELNLIKRLEYTLRLTEEPLEKLSWTLLEGPFQRNSGGWTLVELADERTLASYRIDVVVAAFVPGSIVGRLVGRTLPDTLRAFKSRAESLAASAKA